MRLGGVDGSGPPSTNRVFANDPGTNTWSAAPPLVAGPRRNFAAATDNQGRIYAIAGYTPEFLLATVERFDPALGYWARLPDLPDARQGLAAATGGDGRIYANGGVPFNSLANWHLSTVGTVTSTWTFPEPSAKIPGCAKNSGRIRFG
jgi:hypothetical protein